MRCILLFDNGTTLFEDMLQIVIAEAPRFVEIANISPLNKMIIPFSLSIISFGRPQKVKSRVITIVMW